MKLIKKNELVMTYMVWSIFILIYCDFLKAEVQEKVLTPFDATKGIIHSTLAITINTREKTGQTFETSKPKLIEIRRKQMNRNRELQKNINKQTLSEQTTGRAILNSKKPKREFSEQQTIHKLPDTRKVFTLTSIGKFSAEVLDTKNECILKIRKNQSLADLYYCFENFQNTSLRHHRSTKIASNQSHNCGTKHRKATSNKIQISFNTTNFSQYRKNNGNHGEHTAPAHPFQKYNVSNAFFLRKGKRYNGTGAGMFHVGNKRNMLQSSSFFLLDPGNDFRVTKAYKHHSNLTKMRTRRSPGTENGIVGPQYQEEIALLIANSSATTYQPSNILSSEQGFLGSVTLQPSITAHTLQNGSHSQKNFYSSVKEEDLGVFQVEAGSKAKSQFQKVKDQKNESNLETQVVGNLNGTTNQNNIFNNNSGARGKYEVASLSRPAEMTKTVARFKIKYPVKLWTRLGLYDDTYLESVNPHWLKFDPPNPIIHKIFAALYALFMVVGCGGNILVIFMFIRCRSLRTPPNFLIVNLAVSDFLMMAKTPIFIVNSLYYGPILGASGCKIYGFVGGLTGTASIMTLASIALDRYYVIVHPLNPFKRTTSARALLMIAGVWVYSGVFSSFPLFGINNYTSEGYLTSCSFDYLAENFRSRVFVFIFFLAAWLLPITIITFSYFNIFRMVRATERMEIFHNGSGRNSGNSYKFRVDKDKQTSEMKIAILSAGIISLWLLAWTPYALVALLGIFGWKEYLTPFVSSIPALFCKSASCIDPFVYSLNHPRFQRELRSKFKICFCYDQKRRRQLAHEASFYSTTCRENANMDFLNKQQVCRVTSRNKFTLVENAVPSWDINKTGSELVKQVESTTDVQGPISSNSKSTKSLKCMDECDNRMEHGEFEKPIEDLNIDLESLHKGVGSGNCIRSTSKGIPKMSFKKKSITDSLPYVKTTKDFQTNILERARSLPIVDGCGSRDKDGISSISGSQNVINAETHIIYI